MTETFLIWAETVCIHVGGGMQLWVWTWSRNSFSSSVNSIIYLERTSKPRDICFFFWLNIFIGGIFYCCLLDSAPTSPHPAVSSSVSSRDFLRFLEWLLAAPRERVWTCCSDHPVSCSAGRMKAKEICNKQEAQVSKHNMCFGQFKFSLANKVPPLPLDASYRNSPIALNAKLDTADEKMFLLMLGTRQFLICSSSFSATQTNNATEEYKTD